MLARWGEIRFITALIITLTSIVYGVLHSLAWQYSFSSKFERLLWQISSVSTSSSGLILFAVSLSDWIYLLHWRSRRVRDFYHRAGYFAQNTMYFAQYTMYHGIKWIAYAMILLNIASRAFLFVESFVALPNSPKSTYAIPSWTSYIPHL
jgi:hypothetical protein